MLNISNIQPYSNNTIQRAERSSKKSAVINNNATIPSDLKKVSNDNLKAYIPSFCGIKSGSSVSKNKQLKLIESKLDAEAVSLLKQLDEVGILDKKESNDGSSVIDNLYKMATEPRIPGLSDSLLIKETLQAIANPCSITQKFGDIPDNVATDIEQETGKPLPQKAYNCESHSCTAASIEFTLAMENPAEFARYAQSLSGKDYSVSKNLKVSEFSMGLADAIGKLSLYNTDYSVNSWDDITVNLKPDRNAIVRARVQTSYKDPGERSCIDVLIQSALLNLGSQHTYDSIVDERTGDLNPDNSGLTDAEKNFVEEIVFSIPKLDVLYQNINMDGILTGHNCEIEETKQHIINSLNLGHNVIIGYTDVDTNNQIIGGHEITIMGYKTDENGNEYFICNDTDDNKDYPIALNAEKLLPMIHHASIPKDALNEGDIALEPWREILDLYQESRK